MNSICKFSLKINSIEFLLEGSESYVNKEKEYFLETILPLIRGELGMPSERTSISSKSSPISDSNINQPNGNSRAVSSPSISLNETLIQYAGASQLDQALVMIKYAVESGKYVDVGSMELKECFRDGRIKVPRNPSDVLQKLAQKGFLQRSADKSKKYVITQTGSDYLANYKPTANKDPNNSVKSKKISPSKSSRYQGVTREQLNLDNYPLVKSQKDFKSKLILTMYIVNTQGIGEEFSVSDCVFLMKELMKEKATNDQVRGIFQRNLDWFSESQDQLRSGGITRKLLNPALDFAKEIIEQHK